MPPENINQTPNVLLEWTAPSRPFKTRSREFYRTVGAITLLVVIILFFSQEYLLIGVVLSILFLLYVLSSVPPEQITNKVTNLGIQTGEHFHKWEEMGEFWFDTKLGEPMLIVHLLIGFPTHLQLLLQNVDQNQLKKLISEHIPFREKPVRTALDNAADWLVHKIPLEKSA